MAEHMDVSEANDRIYNIDIIWYNSALYVNVCNILSIILYNIDVVVELLYDDNYDIYYSIFPWCNIVWYDILCHDWMEDNRIAFNI